MMISRLYYEDLIIKMFEKTPDTPFEFVNDMIYAACDAYYPDLWFMFDERWIQVSAKDYLQPANDDGSVCIFMILPVNLPMNIFGMPLLVDYYTVHDPATGVI